MSFLETHFRKHSKDLNRATSFMLILTMLMSMFVSLDLVAPEKAMAAGITREFETGGVVSSFPDFNKVNTPTLNVDGTKTYKFDNNGDTTYGVTEADGVWTMIIPSVKISGEVVYQRVFYYSGSSKTSYAYSFTDKILDTFETSVKSRFNAVDESYVKTKDVSRELSWYQKGKNSDQEKEVAETVKMNFWPFSFDLWTKIIWPKETELRDAIIDGIGLYKFGYGTNGDNANKPYEYVVDRNNRSTYSPRALLGYIAKYADGTDSDNKLSLNIMHIPAFDIDTSKIILVKNASTNVGQFISASSIANSNQLKTLMLVGEDKSQLSTSFARKELTNVGVNKTYTFNYTGASTKTLAPSNATNYVSAIIYDSTGKVVYYEKINQITSSAGTASITIPSDLKVGSTYYLALFEEEETKGANYASTPVYSKFTVQLDANKLSVNSKSIKAENSTTITADDVTVSEYNMADTLTNSSLSHRNGEFFVTSTLDFSSKFMMDNANEPLDFSAIDSDEHRILFKKNSTANYLLKDDAIAAAKAGDQGINTIAVTDDNNSAAGTGYFALTAFRYENEGTDDENVIFTNFKVPLSNAANTNKTDSSYNGDITWEYTPEKVNGQLVAANVYTHQNDVSSIIDTDNVLHVPQTINTANNGTLKVISIGGGTIDKPFVPSVNMLYTQIDFEGANKERNVKEIKDYAFYGSSAYSNVDIPSSISIVGDYAFAGFSHMLTATLNGSKVGVGAFANNDSLTTVVLNGATLGSGAFANNPALKKVVAKGSVNIGAKAFAQDENLDAVNLTEASGTIGSRAFYNDKNLIHLTMTADTSESKHFSGTIEGYAFENCKGLESVYIPSGTTVKAHAFENCGALSTVQFNGSTLADESFANCDSISTLILGNGVATVQSNWGGYSEDTYEDASEMNSATATNLDLYITNGATKFEFKEKSGAYYSAFGAYYDGEKYHKNRRSVTLYPADTTAAPTVSEVTNGVVTATIGASGSFTGFSNTTTKPYVSANGIISSVVTKSYTAFDGSAVEDAYADGFTAYYDGKLYTKDPVDPKKIKITTTRSDGSTGTNANISNFYYYDPDAFETAIRDYLTYQEYEMLYGEFKGTAKDKERKAAIDAKASDKTERGYVLTDRELLEKMLSYSYLAEDTKYDANKLNILNNLKAVDLGERVSAIMPIGVFFFTDEANGEYATTKITALVTKKTAYDEIREKTSSENLSEVAEQITKLTGEVNNLVKQIEEVYIKKADDGSSKVWISDQTEATATKTSTPAKDASGNPIKSLSGETVYVYSATDADGNTKYFYVDSEGVHFTDASGKTTGETYSVSTDSIRENNKKLQDDNEKLQGDNAQLAADKQKLAETVANLQTELEKVTQSYKQAVSSLKEILESRSSSGESDFTETDENGNKYVYVNDKDRLPYTDTDMTAKDENGVAVKDKDGNDVVVHKATDKDGNDVYFYVDEEGVHYTDENGKATGEKYTDSIEQAARKAAAELQEIGKKLTTLNEELTDLRAGFGQIAEDLGEYLGCTAEEFNALSDADKITKIKDALAKIKSDLADAQAQATAGNADNSAAETIKDLRTALNNIRKAAGLVSKTADTIADISDINAEITAIAGDIDSLISTLKDLGIEINLSDTATVSEKMSAVKTAIAELIEKYNAVNSDYAEVLNKIYGSGNISEKSISDVVKDIESLQSGTSDICAKIDSVLQGKDVTEDEARTLAVLLDSISEINSSLKEKTDLMNEVSELLNVTSSKEIIQKVIELKETIAALESGKVSETMATNLAATIKSANSAAGTVTMKALDATTIGEAIASSAGSTAGDILAAADVNVEGASGSTNVAFEIDAVKSGDDIVVLHKNSSGKWETLTENHTEGSVTATFESFSPVVIMSKSSAARQLAEANKQIASLKEQLSNASSKGGSGGGTTNNYYYEDKGSSKSDSKVVKELKDQVSDLQKNVNSLTGDKSTLTEKNNTLTKENSDLTSKNSTLSEQIKSLTEQNVKLNQELGDLKQNGSNNNQAANNANTNTSANTNNGANTSTNKGTNTTQTSGNGSVSNASYSGGGHSGYSGYSGGSNSSYHAVNANRANGSNDSGRTYNGSSNDSGKSYSDNGNSGNQSTPETPVNPENPVDPESPDIPDEPRASGVIGKFVLESLPIASGDHDNVTVIPFETGKSYIESITANVASFMDTSAIQKENANVIMNYFAANMGELGSKSEDADIQAAASDENITTTFTGLTTVEITPNEEQLQSVANQQPAYVTLSCSGVEDGAKYMIIHESSAREGEYDILIVEASDGELAFELDDFSPVSVAAIDFTETEPDEPTPVDEPEDNEDNGGMSKALGVILVIAILALAAYFMKKKGMLPEINLPFFRK